MKTLGEPSVKRDIIQRLQRLTPETQRRWGKMTPHQMICHLKDAYWLVMIGKHASVRGTRLQQTIVRWGALHTPVPWPKGLKTVPAADQELGGTKPLEFQQDLHDLIALVERFTQESKSLDRKAHPFCGKLSEWEWLRWGYLHTDHHLRQFGL